MFRIEMLPAREGDCLWITYGPEGDLRHILIDGGRKATAQVVRQRLADLKAAGGRLELLIVSHIDRDHIEGVLELLEAKGGLGVEVCDVWFNAFHHLPDTPTAFEAFGAVQGERLSKALEDQGLNWNAAFGHDRVCLPDGALPVIPLKSGMTLTLLSPSVEKLQELKPVWKRECEKAGLSIKRAKADGDPSYSVPAGVELQGGIDIEALALAGFGADGSEPNGSSIAVLATYDEKTALLAADAHADVLISSLETLNGPAPQKLDLFKIGHHGSAANTSVDLLKRVTCGRFLISTNGSYFQHPDESAIARIIRHAPGAELVFNYRTKFSEIWDDAGLMDAHGYTTRYPEKASNGSITIDL